MTISEAALAGELTGFGHRLLQRVYFEDTDFSGLVYHARYLHFAERARSDYLRLLGVHHAELAGEGLAFAVRHMELDFLKPARIDDILRVETRPAEVSGARLRLGQKVFRGEDLLFEAAVTVVLIGPGGRPQRMPPRIRALFSAAE
ncbi:(3S)-malyl-CoA thioesterase [Faunimonas pinastri]|uniref:(3S)-malyl-CoA thioesterase n=1 Tax=Faunimonas pinastri TaxID=1855383 RepID=A0A1H8Z6T0_9HYPH|nr:tol-pal system-associated acyl-CoA thioesterase [Faunimonas pinastri]SEP60165.1 (3S)-malyl-CoA thioesterase [Faunimonas pinastri]